MHNDEFAQQDTTPDDGLDVTTSPDARRVTQQDDAERSAPNQGDDAHELDVDAARAELKIEQQVVEAYTGILPHPSIYNQYETKEKEALLRYADALILRESDRQDRLVDAEITNSRISLWLTWILLLTFFIGAVIAFIYTRDARALWLMTPGILSALLGFSQPVASRSSRDKDTKEHGD